MTPPLLHSYRPARYHGITGSGKLGGLPDRLSKPPGPAADTMKTAPRGLPSTGPRDDSDLRENLPMAKTSNYQQKIIKNFYKNRDAISLQKLQESVTDLYLAEGKKVEQVWKRVIGHLETLGLPQPRIDHLVKQGKPELVAKVVEELMKKAS